MDMGRVKIQLLIKIFNILMSLLSMAEAQNFFPPSNTTDNHVIPYTTLCNFIDHSPNSTIICVKGYITNYTSENRRIIPFPEINRSKRHITPEDGVEDLLFEINFNDTNQDKSNNTYLLSKEDIRLDEQLSEYFESNKISEETASGNDVLELNQAAEGNDKLASKFIGILQIKVPHVIRPYFWRPLQPAATENANNHDFTNTGFKIPNFLALPGLFWDRLNRRGSTILSNAQNAIFGSGDEEGHDEYPAAFRRIEDSKKIDSEK